MTGSAPVISLSPQRWYPLFLASGFLGVPILLLPSLLNIPTPYSLLLKYLFEPLPFTFHTATTMTAKGLLLLQLALTLLSSPLSLVYAFTMSSTPTTGRHPHCDLPGDPSLILQTNVDLGDEKAAILKELSALVATSLGKPESYVGK